MNAVLAVSTGQPERIRVLIADGKAAARAALRSDLAGFADEILEAADGAAALQAAGAEELAAILLDPRLPMQPDAGAGDGAEILRRLRALPSVAATPILLASDATLDPDLRQRSVELGASGFLPDPPREAAAVQAQLRGWLALSRQRRTLQQQLAQLRDDNRRLERENRQFRAARQELVHQATHDSLTGLPNRALFDDRLMSALQRSRRHRQQFALAYVDLDNFKHVNDRHGHAAGDEALVETARRLSSRLRACDTVARIGGDEFGILFEELDAPARAASLGGRLIEALQPPLVLAAAGIEGGARITLGASIGIALYPADASGADRLLLLADRAMYKVKQRGGCGVQLHAESLSA